MTRLNSLPPCNTLITARREARAPLREHHTRHFCILQPSFEHLQPLYIPSIAHQNVPELDVEPCDATAREVAIAREDGQERACSHGIIDGWGAACLMSVPPFSFRRLSEERLLLTPMKVEGHPPQPIGTELRRDCRRGVPDGTSPVKRFNP